MRAYVECRNDMGALVGLFGFMICMHEAFALM
jgi:hypothetical protein